MCSGLTKNAKALKGGSNVTMSTDSRNNAVTIRAPDVYTKTEVENKFDSKAPKESPIFTGTASVDNVKIKLTDNSLGYMMQGEMSTLGGLTVNGSALITAINGYATQAALGIKANTADVYSKTSVDNALSVKRATLNNGGGSVPSPVYLCNGVTGL